MAKKKLKDPEALSQVDVTIPEPEYAEFVGKLVDAVQTADDARLTWKEKLTRWYKKRYSIRPEKNFPWPGCSNLNIPLVDKTIRKMKPSFVGLAVGQEHTCYFNPVGYEDVPKAQKVEQFFDWLTQVRMKILMSLVLVTDRMLEQGWGIVKVCWKYQRRFKTKTLDLDQDPIDTSTDEAIVQYLVDTYKYGENDVRVIDRIISKIRKGDRQIPTPVEIEVYNAPEWVVIANKDFIVPAGTKDLQDAPWCCHRTFFYPKDLKEMELEGKFDEDVVNEIIARNLGANTTNDAETLEVEKEARTGVYDLLGKTGDPIEFWEIFCYYDINDDGREEKCVLDICPSFDKKRPARFIEFDYDHGKWPFAKVCFEQNDDDFASPRGIPEILDHLATEITTQHNQKLDRNTLANAFMYKYKPGVVNPDNIRFIPGQGIPVNDMEALQPFIVSDVEINTDREELTLKAWAEEYVGTPDMGMGSLQGSSQPKTKYEIQQSTSKSQQVFFSLDGLIFKECLRELYEQTWALFIQFGPEETWARVMGEPWKAFKEDLAGNYDLQPGGKMGMYNPVLDAQIALADLQMFKGDPYINQKELRLAYLRTRDERTVKRLMLSDDMIKAGLDARTAMMAASGGKGAPGQAIQQIGPGAGGQG